MNNKEGRRAAVIVGKVKLKAEMDLIDELNTNANNYFWKRSFEFVCFVCRDGDRL